MPDMRKWSEAKLEKEMAFAKPADDGGPQCAAWNAALQKEWARRHTDPATGKVRPFRLTPAAV